MKTQPKDQNSEFHKGRAYPAISYAPLESVGTILTRLDIQATQLLPNRKTHLRPNWLNQDPRIFQDIPSSFNSLEEAKYASDNLWNFCLYSLQAPEDGNLSHHEDTRKEKLQVCLDKLKQCSAVFERFMDFSRNKLDSKGRQAANVMQINKIVAEISLSMNSEDENDEAVRASHNADFAAILSLATEIIDSSADALLAGEMALFSLDTCVVGPLYFVATRCCYKILCGKAVCLLRLSPRVEGLCDSYLLAQIAERVQNIEECQGQVPHCDVSDLPRVSDVDMEFDRDGRRAAVQYLRQGGATEAIGNTEMDWVVW
jgi:hypothetical protein